MKSTLSWEKLKQLTAKLASNVDYVNGPTNSKAKLRLFGKNKNSLRVTLYRDNHAWCPYCQKVWLFLEEKQIPYAIEKVTMFCYGKKESWYTDTITPSGMLPALKLDSTIYTESDDIILALERTYGPLTLPMLNSTVIEFRRLERRLFRAWCQWLCYPSKTKTIEEKNMKNYIHAVKECEAAISKTPGPFFLSQFSVVDVIFTPYVERMNASLFYYKGFSLRHDKNPRFKAWFDAMETRSSYRGTLSDFHTHVHDLPPQMGGCFESKVKLQVLNKQLVDRGPYSSIPETSFDEPLDSREIAMLSILQHKDVLAKVNPYNTKGVLDEALQCVLTNMMMMTPSISATSSSRIGGSTTRSTTTKNEEERTGDTVLIQTNANNENISWCIPPKGSEQCLMYLHDRINVPRDMPLYSARRLREAILFTTGLLIGDDLVMSFPISISSKHRRDQNPVPFKR